LATLVQRSIYAGSAAYPDELTGEAGTTILMSEFGIGPISIAGILNTEDEIKLSFTFVARP
jgi:hypothetical protein